MTSPDEVRKELESALNNINVNGDHFDMVIKEQSTIFYKRYKSLIDAGFGEDQAFQIVLNRGLT